MKRLVAAVLLVLGTALIVVGIGSATWWKESPIVEATTPTTSDAGIVATDPDVLDFVDDTVRVTARAPGTEVEMVVAGAEEASIWLGDEPHVAVVVTDEDTLGVVEVGAPAEDEAETPEETEGAEETESAEETEDAEGETEGADGAAEDTEPAITLQGYDLFHPENFISGPDSAELYFAVPDEEMSLIAVGQDGSTPQLTFTWEREVTSPWAIPLMIIGLVLLAAGSAIFLFSSQQRAVADRRAESLKRSESRKTADATETSIFPAVQRPARDPESESEERAGLSDETGGALGAGILPASPRADELRSAGQADDADTEPHRSAIDANADDAAADPAVGTVPAGEEHAAAEDLPEGDDSEQGPLEERAGEPSERETRDDSADIENNETTSRREDRAEAQEETKRASSANWRSLWGFGPKE